MLSWRRTLKSEKSVPMADSSADERAPVGRQRGANGFCSGTRRLSIANTKLWKRHSYDIDG